MDRSTVERLLQECHAAMFSKPLHDEVAAVFRSWLERDLAIKGNELAIATLNALADGQQRTIAELRNSLCLMVMDAATYGSVSESRFRAEKLLSDLEERSDDALQERPTGQERRQGCVA